MIIHNAFVKTIKVAAFIILFVAIFALLGRHMDIYSCILSDYSCVFSLLLKMAGLILVVYIGYRIVLL